MKARPLSRQKSSAVARVRVWAATKRMSSLLPWTALTSERPQRPNPRTAARIIDSCLRPPHEGRHANIAAFRSQRRRWIMRRGERALPSAAIIGVGQSAYVRHPQPDQSTHTFMRDAVVAALADAQIAGRDVQGMAIASLSLEPDRAVDVAWKLGLSLRWLLQDT